MKRAELNNLFNELLTPDRFKDVAENGLQVEGTDDIKRVITGVSANLDLIEHAVAANADAVFVHHGIVWGGGMRSIKGWLHKRVALLIKNEINLFAYHLPLDAHPTLGNNAGLADALGIGKDRKPFGNYKGQDIGVAGQLSSPVSFGALCETATKNVGKPLAAFGAPDRAIKTVALCSGGAPDLLHEAIDIGADLYVTGEVTEWVKGVAEESGACFLALGHHASEVFGAQRVAAHLTSSGVDAEFVNISNPA